MFEFFQKLFSSDFAPHVYCLRLPGLIQLNLWSDLLIGLSYFLIPFSLMRLVKRRNDLVFPWMFALFGLFILSCGMTHILGAWTLWHPIYRFDAFVKAITALASLPTAILLTKIIPRAIELPSPEQLRVEVAERKRAELQVRELNVELEDRIQERTSALLQANELLAQSERRRLLAVEAGGVGTWFWNIESGDIYWDQNSKAMFGIESEAVMTLQRFYDAVCEEDLGRMQSAVSEAVKTGTLPTIECGIRRSDGSERWIRFRGSSDTDSKSNVRTLQGTMIDVTEQKRMGLAVARLASIVESSDDAVIGLDLNGRITSWNRAAGLIFGYDTEEVMGRSIALLDCDENLESFEAQLRRIRRGERIEHFETVRRRKGAVIIDVSLTVSPIFNHLGDVIGVSEIARDITRRKELDNALRTSEERFRTLAETVPDVLFTADSRGVINFLSARFFSELDHTKSDSDLHRTFLSPIHPDDSRRFLEAFQTSVQSGAKLQAELRLRKLDGSYGWFVVRALPIADEQSSTLQWIGAATDVDRLKRAEEALIRSNGELRQFAYAAAHDLQEPLRNIVNAAGMLSVTAGDQLDQSNRPYLQFCIEGARRMHGMIKDLLSYTAVVDGPVVNTSRTDTESVMNDVLANLSLSIQETHAEIHFESLPEVAVEKLHLLQIFQNIVGNALKYRSPDQPPLIRITASRQDEKWLFRVADNGIGFKPEYSERIFGVFKRLHQRHEFPGSGIGLAICARIVSHYGGTIWAESEPGKGAVFCFTLPAVRRLIPLAPDESLRVAGVA